MIKKDIIIKIGLAQTKPYLGQVKKNLKEALQIIGQAQRKGCDMVVFPELALTGYFLKDLFADVAIKQQGPESKALARASKKISVLIGCVEEGDDHRFFNAAYYFERGKLHGVHRKVYLPTYGLFDEARDLAPGDRIDIIQTRFGKLGVMICEDAWHPSVPYLLSLAGADYMAVISSSPIRGFAPGQAQADSVQLWSQIGISWARLLTTPLIYCNRTGVEEGISFGGGSYLVDARGRISAESKNRKPGLSLGRIVAQQTRAARISTPLLRDERPHLIAAELQRILVERGEAHANVGRPESSK